MAMDKLTFGGLLGELRFHERAPVLCKEMQDSEGLRAEWLASVAELVKRPEYNPLKTVCKAAGCDVTSEAVERLAAAAAVKRGLTLADLHERSAAEVVVWMAESSGGESVELTKKQLHTILDISGDTVPKWIASGAIKVKREITSKRLEVFVDCLPADWKERLEAATGKK